MAPGIGVFGTGTEVKVLVGLLREKLFHVVAVWGKTFKEAESIAEELKIEFFTNKIDDVLLRKDVDLVFIMCSPFLHSEISVKALGIGKHVICDRPMGLDLADSLKMVRASQYYPSLISLVNHSLRFLPSFSHMKRALNEGLIGPISDVSLIDIRVQTASLLRDTYDWYCDASMGGGTLNLIGSHVVDMVTYLTGRKAVRVHGIVRTYTKTTSMLKGIREISAPDFCTFQMELENGILVTISIHSHTLSKSMFVQDIAVYGTNGQLVIKGDNLYLFRTNSKSAAHEETIYEDLDDLKFPTSYSALPQPYIKGLSKMLGALREAFEQEDSKWIKDPVQIAATFDDGLYVQSVLDAIKKSSERRSWVRVEAHPVSATKQG